MISQVLYNTVLFLVDLNGGTGCGEAGPLGVLDRLLGHGRVHAPVDEGLQSGQSIQSLELWQQDIFLACQVISLESNTITLCTGC